MHNSLYFDSNVSFCTEEKQKNMLGFNLNWKWAVRAYWSSVIKLFKVFVLKFSEWLHCSFLKTLQKFHLNHIWKAKMELNARYPFVIREEKCLICRPQRIHITWNMHSYGKCSRQRIRLVFCMCSLIKAFADQLRHIPILEFSKAQCRRVSEEQM